MREIKFRAYIKNNKKVNNEVNKLVEVKSIHLGSKKAIIGYSKSKTNYGNYSISFDDIELMQYTGLKDKNGKEIYEGDILREYDNEIQDWVVSYEYGKFIGIWDNICEDLYELSDLEVIGNIYDNPELLEEEK